MTVRISAIAAMSKNGVIGRDNALPWRIPADLAHFKRVTMGKPVIMGRKTYESLGRPLPGRANIVVSRTPGSVTGDVIAADTLDSAIQRAIDIAQSEKQDEVFIIGGAQIYAAAMPRVARLYLTIVARDYDGDAFFPPLNTDEWIETARDDFSDPEPFSIRVLDRA